MAEDVRRLVDEHVCVAVEAVVEPAAHKAAEHRHVRRLVVKAGGEHHAVGKHRSMVRLDSEFAGTLISSSNGFDAVSVVFRPVLFELRRRYLEKLVPRRVFSDSNNVVRIPHQRRAPATAIDNCRLVTEAGGIHGRG